MTDGDWRVGELGRLARRLSLAEDDGARLSIAVEHAVRLLDGCEHASVTALQRGRLATEGASSDVAVRADLLQYDSDEGPCLDALREQEPVVCPDLRGDQRWAEWSPRALAATPVRGVVSVPLRTSEGAFGSLNLYAVRPHAFQPADLSTAEAVAAALGAAVSAGREIDQLSTALRSRTVIGQAEGILMERLGIDSDQAFAYLRRISQDTNRKLVQVATEIVRTRRLPDSEG